MIEIAIYNDYQLGLETLTKLIADIPDFKVTLSSRNIEELIQSLKKRKAHILVYSLPDDSIKNLIQISQLKVAFPRMSILILSQNDGDEIIMKAVKSGARGFLGKDSNTNDLKEAILTLRNGYEYFGNSITRMVLNRYITSLDTPEQLPGNEIKQLSARQIEILKLWGQSLSNQEIADKLYISVRTVETHKNHIMQKLNLKSTVDMVKFAIKNNIIEI
jgi:two-component system response regulator NreC